MIRHPLTLSAIALTLCAAVELANPATATNTFQVTATVNALCKVSAANLAFGTAYTPGAGPANTTSTISVNCTKTTPFTVALSSGSSGTFTTRAMGGVLAYQLYADSAQLTIWGDGSSTTSTMPGTGMGMGSGQAVSLTVYGQIPDTAANQAAAPGTYTDTVTATVTY